MPNFQISHFFLVSGQLSECVGYRISSELPPPHFMSRTPRKIRENINMSTIKTQCQHQSLERAHHKVICPQKNNNPHNNQRYINSYYAPSDQICVITLKKCLANVVNSKDLVGDSLRRPFRSRSPDPDSRIPAFGHSPPAQPLSMGAEEEFFVILCRCVFHLRSFNLSPGLGLPPWTKYLTRHQTLNVDFS